MDNSWSNRHNEHLGVNKLGKSIRKSPLHQPSFSNNTSAASTASTAPNTARQQPQPQVYNISKNDFRNVVQQLTGSPSHDSLPRPPNNSPKPPSLRLQKIRPPPLAPMNRPRQMYPPIIAAASMPPPVPVTGQGPGPPQAHFNNGYLRPGQHGGHPSPAQLTPGNSLWANTADSPISVYMRYLQNSMLDSGPRHPPPSQQPQFQPQGPGPRYPPPAQQPQFQPQGPGPRYPPPAQQPQFLPQAPGLVQNQHQLQPLPPPQSDILLPNPTMPPPLPSPRMNFPTFPSPTSQFLLPSPNFFNMLSPRSPYPLLSPGIQYPQPLTPNFPFSSMAQSGIIGPGPQPPPFSPGIVFPLSPSGFFPMSSPRWNS